MKKKTLIIELEPRIMFDAVGAAVIENQVETASTDKSNTKDTSTQNVVETIDANSSLAKSSDKRNELVVIDGGLKDVSSLVDEIRAIDSNRTVMVLDSTSDEVSQLTSYLAEHTGEFDAIHVLSHGGTGFFSLGNQTLDLSTPEQNATLWNSVKTALTENGDVLLYGCNVGSDVNAQTEVTQLAQITGADFAVSTDITGASGNWVLEYQSGSIETSSISATDYAGDLASMATPVANIDVNEGSPYVVFRFTGSGGVTRLTLTPGTATASGVDFGAAPSSTNLQYSTDGGVNWYGYSVANGFTTVANTEFLVRTPIVNDTLLEGPEGFSITASVNGATASANVTIHDDGTGQWFTGSSGTGSTRPPAGQYLDGDMPLSVNTLVVNEGSPYAIWSVTYGEGKVVKLTLSDGTQAEASQMGLIGAASVTNDLTLYNAGHQMETSVDGGTTWSTYTAGSGVAMGESCNLLVRVKVNNDTPYEVSEVLNLDVKQVLAGTANTITDNTVGLVSRTIDNIKVISGATTLDATANLLTNNDYSTIVGWDVYWGPAGNGPNKIPGWTASGGGTATYARWSGNLVYFGNQSGWSAYETGSTTTAYDPTTLFDSRGVTATPMTFIPGYPGFGDNDHPLTLSQTINTEVGKTYRIQFTQSREGWGSQDGIAALKITGFERVYFRVYHSHDSVYTLEFTATTTTTDISFMNWGHIGTTADELKLGKVIVNKVPEVVGALTILDNGQGDYYNGDRTTPLSSSELTTASIALNDDRAANPVVNDITVNEGSPYAVFTVNGMASAVVELSLLEGTDAAGSSGADVTGLQVSTDGTNWVDYNASSLPALNTEGILFVRTVPVNDAVYEQTETVTLTATYTGAGAAVTANGADSGVATIKDDGTGQWFSGTGSSAGTGSNTAPNGSYLNDERPVTVTGFTANEASPYGIFTVGGAAGQYVKLTLSDGTATGGATTPTDGSVDYNTNLQYYNGTAWVAYTPNAFVQLNSAGKLLVRTAIVNDTVYEGAQTLNLTASNTQGTPSTAGVGTIKDDGTGDLYSVTNTTGTPDAKGSQADLQMTMLNDDRPPAVNTITVNEASPYAVFTVGYTGGRSITLSLQDGTAKGGTTAPTDGTVDYKNNALQYSLDGGATWVSYSAPFTSTLTGAGTTTGLLVRTTMVNDTVSDNSETFKLTATVTGSTLGTTGTATIKDDGTGLWFTGTSGTGSSSAPAGSYLDDDTPVTVNNITVNEGDGTNYAVFTVSAKEGQRVSMTIAGLATTGASAATANVNGDFTSSTLEYWNGSSWVSYTPSSTTFITVPSDGDATAGERTNLLVRVKILADTNAETGTSASNINGESFKLTAYNGSGIANVADANGDTGICVIKDNGTGTIYQTNSSTTGVTPGDTTNPPTATTLTAESATYVTAAQAVDSTPLANDDRTLSVNAITVNEGSQAVFTVTGKEGQYVKLALSNGTASGGTTSPTDGTVDYLNNSLQYYNGTTWVDYTPGDFVKITDASGTIKVRTTVVNDTVVDNSQTFNLVATNTGGVSATGIATIKDDGTGTIYDASGNAMTNATAAVVTPAQAALTPLPDDDRAVSITSVTVNEGSPYAEFTVSAASGQYVKLDLASGTATAGADFSTLEYFNGTTWTAYTADSYVKMTATTMKVRVAITNDTVADNGETFTVTASNTGGSSAVGTGTIKDDGTGDKYTYASATTSEATKTTGSTNATAPTAGFDDDRPLTVTGATVNEASPYLVFEVAGASGQYVTLAPASGTAILGTDTTYAGSTSDKVLQYFNGTSWDDYTAGSKIQIPSNTSGKLLVRTKVVNDGSGLSNGPYEMAETIKLTATNTGGGGTTGLGTIVDNGTGSIYLAATNSFTPATSGTTGYPTSLDDDRINNPAFVNNVEVNEGSPFVVFTVSGVRNAKVLLAVSNGSAVGGSAANPDGSVDFDNVAAHLEYYNGSTWVAYDAANPPQLSSAAAGDLKVRVPIFADTVLDGGETFNLTVQYAAAGLQVAGVPSLNSATYTGTAVIKDDGTGTQWDSNAAPIPAYDSASDPVIPATPIKAVLDDDRPVTVNDITVNEGSPYAVFTVTAKESQYVRLVLDPGSTNPADPTSNADYTPALEYWNGSQWIAYTTGTFVAVPNDGDTTTGEAANLLVRVAISNDTPYEGAETFNLTAYNTTGAGDTGVATIHDDGTGEVFTTQSGANGGGVTTGDNTSSTPAMSATHTSRATANVVVVGSDDKVLLDDDRLVSVNDVSVNEGSPYAAFTVTGVQNQYVKLELSSGSATVGTDTGTALQYFDGSSWVNYDAGSFVKITDASGTLQVRTTIVNDVPYEGAETFNLTAYNTTGVGDTGVATIHDDGTGTVFAYASNTTATINAQPSMLDDDRSLDVNNITVNEGSPYAVFTVSGVANQLVSLSVADQNGDGADVSSIEYWDGSAWQTYTSGTVALSDVGSGNGELLVRVALLPEQETDLDTGETFRLVVAKTDGTTTPSTKGVATIMDDGTGSVWSEAGTTATPVAAYDPTTDAVIPVTPTKAVLDDDRLLAVNDVSVNEGSYAVFEVSAKEGQYVKLSLGNTASTTDADATLGTDLSTQLEYWNGAQWQSYTAGTYVAVPSDGDGTANEDAMMLVRVATTQDSPFEVAETFTLSATNTSGTSAQGVATIRDDGTGNIWNFSSSSDIGTFEAPGALGVTFDDDRPTFTIGNVTVGEAADNYAVVTVTLSNPSPVPITFTPYLQVGGSTSQASLTADVQNTPSGGRLEYLDVSDNRWKSADAGVSFVTGQTSVQLRSAIVHDSVSEIPETYLIEAVNTNGTLTSGRVTINDYPLVSVSDVTVNEASPYAVVEVTLSGVAAGDVVFVPKLVSDSGEARVDTGTTIEFYNTQTSSWEVGSQWNGTAWVGVAFNGAGVEMGAGETSVLLRTAITHDTLNEVSETVKITTGVISEATVLNQNGATGTITIVDQGSTVASDVKMFSTDAHTTTADLNPATGNVINPATLGATYKILDDDRPLSVNNVTVNEGSPYAVFTVTGVQNQYVKLELSSGSATVGTDTGTALQYFDGSSWVNYDAGSFVKITDASGTLQVRTTIVNDTPYEGAEIFNLRVTNTGGRSTPSSQGVGTIKDDGTGIYFPDENPTNNIPVADPTHTLDNDKPVITPEIPQIKPKVVIDKKPVDTKILVEKQLIDDKNPVESIQTEIKSFVEKTKGISYNEEHEHLAVTNTGRVVVEFEGQHEKLSNDVIEVRVFKMDPSFVKVIVKDSAYREGDVEFQLFSLDGSQAPSWVNINSKTGLITGVPPAGVEKVVLQVKILGKDGKIKSVDVEIKIPKKEQAFNGTLSQQMKLYADAYQNSVQLLDILNKSQRA